MNEFVKLGQTGLLPGPTEIATSFQVKTRLYWLKPCQYLSQLVRTVTLPFLIWGSTVLTQGQTVGGVSSMCLAYQGGDTEVVGVVTEVVGVVLAYHSI